MQPRRTLATTLAASAVILWGLTLPSTAQADDLGALNSLFVAPVALCMLLVLTGLGIWGLLGLRARTTARGRTLRAAIVGGCGLLSSILAPLGVVLLELWTDQHKRSVTWNEFNLAAAGVVALAGLICVALAVGLLSKRDP